MNSQERSEEDSKAPTGNPKEDERVENALDNKPKTPFVFRFLPADPKNSLEFEDMADK
jgi:hypothetical protein